MKAALISLGKALPTIVKLGVFCFILFLVFAVFGIQFKRGTLFHCNTTNIKTPVEILTKHDCMDFGGDWVNNDYNFDNIGNALNIVFQMSTAVNWQMKA